MENKGNQICRKCNGIANPSKALDNTWVGSSDFGGDFGERGTTMSKCGKPQMVDCLKCSNCGHSWVPAKMRKKTLDVALFKAYINKFSKEEKIAAFKLMFDDVPENEKLNFLNEAKIIEWYKLNCY